MNTWSDFFFETLIYVHSPSKRDHKDLMISSSGEVILLMSLARVRATPGSPGTGQKQMADGNVDGWFEFPYIRIKGRWRCGEVAARVPYEFWVTVFIEHVQVSNQSLMPCTKLFPAPSLTPRSIQPESLILLLNVKPSTGKSCLTVL